MITTIEFILIVLARPEYLIGTFTFLGLVVQKKPFSESFSGTIKAIVGFLILNIGAEVIVESLEVFSLLFKDAFKTEGVMPANEAIIALATRSFATEIAFVMLIGMCINIILARITPLKYIFLTGHHTFFMAMLIVITLSTTSLSKFWIVSIGSVVLGLCMAGFPAILQPFTKRIVGNEGMALGHFNSFGYFIAALVGKYSGGKPEKSTEHLNIPRGLSFLQDTTVAVTLTMLILFGILLISAGVEDSKVLLNMNENTSIVSFLIIESLKFAAGLFIILTGVRLLIAEVVPAFRGIAEKIVPSAKPALDCTTIFPYAPNAVIIGFICSFLGGITSIFLLSSLSLVVIIPGIIPHFFTGATAGIYGNITGGRRGAVLGAYANGLLISFIPALLYPIMGSMGFVGTTFGDTDFGLIGLLLSNIIKLF